MEFKKHQPKNILKNYIDHMWILHLGPEDQLPKERFMPDGRFELIIDLKGGFQKFAKQYAFESEPSAFVSGLFTQHIFLTPLPNTTRIGIVFKHGKICHFLNDRTNHLKEYTVLSDLFGLNAVCLIDQLSTIRKSQDQFQVLETFLLKNIKKNDRQFMAIDHAIKYILQHDYTIKIPDLAKECCMSERNFRRVFCEITGLSPRVFIRVIKIGQITKQLRTRSSLSFMETAYRFGFHDPSHFHRRFTEIAGVSPTVYRMEQNVISRMIY